MTPVFECAGLTLRYPGPSPVTIFEGLDLTVEQGEFLTVLGGSGVGKSTLLRILAGLDRPTSGSVQVHGQTVRGAPEDVVMIFQDYSRSLLPWRSVLANAALGLESRTSRNQARARAQEALDMVGLGGSGALRPAELSGGMQQRLQIARALAMEPRVICMDEPFGALDALTKATLQDQVRQLQESTGVTFVFITHDVEEAVYLGDRAIVLAGKPATIVDDVSIDLGAAREQISTRGSEDFLALRARLHAALGHRAVR